MKSKEVIPKNPPAEVVAAGAPVNPNADVVIPGVAVVPTEVVPIEKVPSDTPAKDLPDALAPTGGAPIGTITPLEGESALGLPSTRPIVFDRESAIRQKVAAGLSREQAIEVLDNQAAHDAGLV